MIQGMAIDRVEQQRQDLSLRLEEGLRKLGMDLSTQQQAGLIAYLFELQKWNRTYNLTAVKSIEDMLVQHAFDCLAIVPAINQYEQQHGKEFKLIADIGSGAGLPAVVLAIVRPTSRVVSIDAVEKKTAFVQNAATKLGLVNLQARHDRVETIADIKADLVISRAFASLKNFVDLSKGLTSDTGVIAAMKSKQLETEIQEFSDNQDHWQVHQVDEVSVPELQAKRYLAWLQRKNNE